MKKTKQSLGHYQLLRYVETDKVGLLPIANKKMMREVVTDYIIHQSETHASKIRRLKYDPLRVRVHLNNKEETFPFDIFLILEKFLLMQKQNLDSQLNIESIILAVLQFIAKLTDQGPITLEIEGTITSDHVLSTLLANYFRERQRKYFQNQFLEMRVRKNVRNKILLPKDGSTKNSEQNSQRVSRTTIAYEKQQKSKKGFIPFTKSKLKNLVDSCNVFEYPNRVEALKQEKLIGQYCKSAIDFAKMKQQSKKNYPCQTNPSLSPETAKLLEEWINDINLSEKLFKNKYGCGKDNHNNETQSSSSDSSEQQG